jgi:hypothetical protein
LPSAAVPFTSVPTRFDWIVTSTAASNEDPVDRVAGDQILSARSADQHSGSRAAQQVDADVVRQPRPCPSTSVPM